MLLIGKCYFNMTVRAVVECTFLGSVLFVMNVQAGFSKTFVKVFAGLATEFLQRSKVEICNF